MSALGVSLILLAAVVHAVWNILAKGIRGNGTLFVWWYGLVSSVVLIPVSLLEPGAWQSWGWPLVGAAVVSGLLHTVYGTALQTGYDRAPLGVVYAVARGTGPMITMIVAVLFLGEQLSLTAAAGAIAVLVGVAVVASFGTPTSTRDDDAPPSSSDASDPGAVIARDAAPLDSSASGTSTPEGADGHSPGGDSAATPTRGSALTGVLWGAAVGVCIAGYTLWDDHSMATLDLPPVLYFALTSVVLVLTLTPKAWRQRQDMVGRGPEPDRRGGPAVPARVHPGALRHAVHPGGARGSPAGVEHRGGLAARVVDLQGEPPGAAAHRLRRRAHGHCADLRLRLLPHSPGHPRGDWKTKATGRRRPAARTRNLPRHGIRLRPGPLRQT